MNILHLDQLISFSLKICTIRLISLMRKIPRTTTQAGGDTFLVADCISSSDNLYLRCNKEKVEVVKDGEVEMP